MPYQEFRAAKYVCGGILRVARLMGDITVGFEREGSVRWGGLSVAAAARWFVSVIEDVCGAVARLTVFLEGRVR